jgi:hypothetical protein
MATLYNLALGRTALSQRQFSEAIMRGEKATQLAGPLKRYSAASNFISGLAQVLSGSAAGQAKCELGVSEARASGDPWLLAEALLMFAEARLQAGDSAAAQSAATEAEGIAKRLESADTQVMACLLLARASRASNDSQKARDYATQANTLLSTLEQAWGHDDYNSYLNRPDIQFSRTQVNQILAQKP